MTPVTRAVRTLAVLLAPLVLLAVYRSLPSRGPSRLGVVGGRLSPCPGTPNCVSTQAEDPGHRVAPIAFEDPEADMIRRIKSILATMPRIEVVAERGLYLRAEATSRVFRFVDDVEFLVDPEAKVIHVRSASRVGHTDLGVNRSRIERLRRALGADAEAGSSEP